MPQKKIVIITGPTGTGKTKLAIDLAVMFRAEIVNADSMQVYRGMDIGTAKPGPAEMVRVPHHLFSIVDPGEEFNAALYRKKADEAIAGILSRGAKAFVVGGTGLYLRALSRGLLEAAGPDRSIRARLKALLEERGRERLHEMLARCDPVAAARIHAHDSVRVIRALEVFEQSGRPMSQQQKEHSFSEREHNVLEIGIELEREELYARINRRVLEMVETGLVGEARGLLKSGYDEKLGPMQSLGYRHFVRLIRGELSEKEAVIFTQRDTRHYARRQLTWFAKETAIRWFRPEDKTGIIAEIERFYGAP